MAFVSRSRVIPAVRRCFSMLRDDRSGSFGVCRRSYVELPTQEAPSMASLFTMHFPLPMFLATGFSTVALADSLHQSLGSGDFFLPRYGDLCRRAPCAWGEVRLHLNVARSRILVSLWPDCLMAWPSWATCRCEMKNWLHPRPTLHNYEKAWTRITYLLRFQAVGAWATRMNGYVVHGVHMYYIDKMGYICAAFISSRRKYWRTPE